MLRSLAQSVLRQGPCEASPCSRGHYPSVGGSRIMASFLGDADIAGPLAL